MLQELPGYDEERWKLYGSDKYINWQTGHVGLDCSLLLGGERTTKKASTEKITLIGTGEWWTLSQVN